jgi:probable FeS assembly SUF system protein SufT
MPRTYEPVRFSRDCPAILVPSGAEVIVPEGAEGTLTQALGASFTIYVGGSLLRIKGDDADAIGREPPPPIPVPEHPSTEDIEKLVRDQLHEVYDPEIPINIVDLGLVYALTVEPLPEDPNRFRVAITMTLTAPGCGWEEFWWRRFERGWRRSPRSRTCRSTSCSTRPGTRAGCPKKRVSNPGSCRSPPCACGPGGPRHRRTRFVSARDQGPRAVMTKEGSKL